MATSAQETPSFQSVFETDSNRPVLTESQSYERLHLDEGKLTDKSDSAVLSDAESSCSKKTSMSSPPGFSQPQPQQQRPASLSQKSVSSMSQSSSNSNHSEIFSKETSNGQSISNVNANANQHQNLVSNVSNASAGIIAPMPNVSAKPKSPGPVAKPVGSNSNGNSKKSSVTNTDGSTAVFCDFSKQMHTNKSDSERCHRNIFYQKINSLGLKIARLDMGKRGAKHAFLHLYDCDMQQQLLVRGHLHIESIDCTVRFYEYKEKEQRKQQEMSPFFKANRQSYSGHSARKHNQPRAQIGSADHGASNISPFGGAASVFGDRTSTLGASQTSNGENVGGLGVGGASVQGPHGGHANGHFNSYGYPGENPASRAQAGMFSQALQDPEMLHFIIEEWKQLKSHHHAQAQQQNSLFRRFRGLELSDEGYGSPYNTVDEKTFEAPVPSSRNGHVSGGQVGAGAVGSAPFGGFPVPQYNEGCASCCQRKNQDLKGIWENN